MKFFQNFNSGSEIKQSYQHVEAVTTVPPNANGIGQANNGLLLLCSKTKLLVFSFHAIMSLSYQKINKKQTYDDW